MRALPLLIVGSAGACRDPASEGGDGNVGPTTETGTDGTHDGFAPSFFGVTSIRFAVDDAGRASGFTPLSGEPEPISLEVSIGDASVENQGFTTANSCTVTLVADGPLSYAPWASNDDTWAAYELPASADGWSNCDQLESFPPAWGDPLDVVTSWRWGFGVGALDGAVERALRDRLGAEYADIEPYVVGGGSYWEGLKSVDDPAFERFTDGWVDTGVTFAYEMDEDLVQIGTGNNPVLIEADAIRSAGSVTRGLYDIQGTTLLGPAGILLP